VTVTVQLAWVVAGKEQERFFDTEKMAWAYFEDWILRDGLVRHHFGDPVGNRVFGADHSRPAHPVDKDPVARQEPIGFNDDLASLLEGLATRFGKIVRKVGLDATHPAVRDGQPGPGHLLNQFSLAEFDERQRPAETPVELPDDVNGPNDLIYDPSDPRRMYLSCWPTTMDGRMHGGGLLLEFS